MIHQWHFSKGKSYVFVIFQQKWSNMLIFCITIFNLKEFLSCCVPDLLICVQVQPPRLGWVQVKTETWRGSEWFRQCFHLGWMKPGFASVSWKPPHESVQTTKRICSIVVLSLKVHDDTKTVKIWSSTQDPSPISRTTKLLPSPSFHKKNGLDWSIPTMQFAYLSLSIFK